jgi:hypothetical protein
MEIKGSKVVKDLLGVRVLPVPEVSKVYKGPQEIPAQKALGEIKV